MKLNKRIAVIVLLSMGISLLSGSVFKERYLLSNGLRKELGYFEDPGKGAPILRENFNLNLATLVLGSSLILGSVIVLLSKEKV